MAVFVDHLLCGIYPYLTPAEFIAKCPEAQGLEDDDPDVIDAIEDASLLMYYLLGRQFDGVCETTFRPKPNKCCVTSRRVTSGLWPLTNIIAVREEGEDKDPTDFHIDEYRYIIRNDGEPFPANANWWAETGSTDDDPDEPGGAVFEITVEHGIIPPRLVTRATRALACQIYDGCSSIGPCKLPERTTSVSRNGLTINVADAAEMLKNRRTGIYLVDLAIATFNPSGLQSPSFVWSPDLRRGIRSYKPGVTLGS